MSVPLAPLELLERSRRGETVGAESIAYFVRNWYGGGATDAQMAAWCMLACLQGLDPAAVTALTAELIATGDRLDLNSLGPTGDTHSTGGVGDTTTLVAIPIAAALGVRVAKMSGRGLAHTGGTVDKLEAIPGYQADLHLADFVRQIKDVGCAVISQTDWLTPGDKRLCALRDQTATVQSAGLIAASIMSKKLAGGAAAIALDIKCGDGAFFATPAQARDAAELMVSLAEPWGRSVRWMVTDMSQPLGVAVGNALEVRQAAAVLRGAGPHDLRELGLRVAAELAEASGVAPVGDGLEQAEAAITDGTALAMAERWVEAQGGEPAVWTDDDALPSAPIRLDVVAPHDGWLAALPARALGEAARRLGAGRLHPSQNVDPAVGLELRAKVGHEVTAGEPVIVVHARDMALAEACVADLITRIVVSQTQVDAPHLIVASDA